LERENNNIIEKLCEDLKINFNKRIVCLLYYGSNAYKREVKKSSDYDFCLVLDQRLPNDLNKIKSITKKLFKVEMTLHYLDELKKDGWNNFQSDNHGVFYLYNFASAKSLIGDNIFLRKMHLVKSDEVIASLRRQIIEYFWRLDNCFFTLSDENLVKSDIIRKYSVRIVQDLLLICGDISFFEINEINYSKFFYKFVENKEYFQNDTKALLIKLINNDNILVEDLIELKEKLYQDFRNIIKHFYN